MEPKHFKKKTTFIPFHSGDPAGVLFFGSYFTLSHKLIEQSLIESEIQWEQWFSNPDCQIPIRSVKADYFHPLFPGKNYETQVVLKKLKKSSLEFEVHFFNGKILCTKISMVFVFVNFKKQKIIRIPENFKNKLKPYLSPSIEEKENPK